MQNSYLEASKDLHKQNPEYGKASEYLTPGTMKFALTIPDAITASKKVQNIDSLLDYGTGQGGLLQAIEADRNITCKLFGYDPCISKYSKKPESKFDIVTSIDVLEHIGRDHIHQTLNEISNITNQFFFFCIDLIPASKKIDDGRNAHFLLAPADWWTQRIKEHFKIMTCIEVGELESGEAYPIHLFGCASHSMNNFKAMNEFILHIRCANKRWVWGKGAVRLIDYQETT